MSLVKEALEDAEAASPGISVSLVTHAPVTKQTVRGPKKPKNLREFSRPGAAGRRYSGHAGGTRYDDGYSTYAPRPKTASQIMDPISAWAQGKMDPRTAGIPGRSKTVDDSLVHQAWKDHWIQQASMSGTFEETRRNFRSDPMSDRIQNSLVGLGAEVLSGQGLLGVW